MPGPPAPRRLATALLCAVAFTLLPGCGSAVSEITVSKAFVPVPATADSAAVYLTITNRGDLDDELLSVSSPAASMTHLHRTSIDAQGRAKMSAVGTLKIPAGSTVELGPGGLHLMMMQPDVPAAGATVDLTLRFREAGTKTVAATVTDDISEVLDR